VFSYEYTGVPLVLLRVNKQEFSGNNFDIKSIVDADEGVIYAQNRPEVLNCLFRSMFMTRLGFAVFQSVVIVS